MSRQRLEAHETTDSSHQVTVDVVIGRGGRRSVRARFTCSAPPTAECRTYGEGDLIVDSICLGDTEILREDPARRGGRPCWLKLTFENGHACYVGADAVFDADHGWSGQNVPPSARAGAVAVEIQEDYFCWDWASTVGPSDRSTQGTEMMLGSRQA